LQFISAIYIVTYSVCFFDSEIFNFLISSPPRGGLPPEADAPLAQRWGLLFFDLTPACQSTLCAAGRLTLSYEEREFFFYII
jgi:hypothetical protein